MSEQEELAARDRILTDYIDVKRRLVALQDEARRRGESLRQVATALIAGAALPPELDLEFACDVVRIRAVLVELVEAEVKKRKLQGRLRTLGLEQVD